MENKNEITPDKIISFLKEHIVGQGTSVNAVSCAVYLKYKLDEISDEKKRKNSRPSNMLLTGPTGVGKTEIARRVSEMLNVPFINFPVTRLSERGYVGGKIEDLINAIMSTSLRHFKEKMSESKEAKEKAMESLMKALKLDGIKDINLDSIGVTVVEKTEVANLGLSGPGPNMPPGFPGGVFQIAQYKMEIKILDVDDVIESVALSEAMRDKSQEAQQKEIMEYAQTSIVFLDEIDKLCEEENSGMVSRQGVQYELLPLIEGSSYETQIGILTTDRILFIAAGSFSNSSPDKLIPELQGRLPVRINLNEFEDHKIYTRILGTTYSTTNQQEWILQQDYPKFKFTEDSKKEIAKYAFRINKTGVNTGARVLDRIVQAIVRYYLLTKKTGGITKEDVITVMEKDVVKLEEDSANAKKIGF